MNNLIVFYSKDKNILKIVSKYRKDYNASIYEIETVKDVGFFSKLFNLNVAIKHSNLNLSNYQNIILISPLWSSKVPSPVIRFLEQNTGHVNHISYILYNNNKNDNAHEFDKMDRILNLRRDKSYFVSLNKNDINVRVYQ